MLLASRNSRLFAKGYAVSQRVAVSQAHSSRSGIATVFRAIITCGDSFSKGGRDGTRSGAKSCRTHGIQSVDSVFWSRSDYSAVEAFTYMNACQPDKS